MPGMVWSPQRRDGDMITLTLGLDGIAAQASHLPISIAAFTAA
tara:strand:+ start:209 stop:337 length:129 start_codon:yes stop_codon:yes gene_type:complete